MKNKNLTLPSATSLAGLNSCKSTSFLRGSALVMVASFIFLAMPASAQSSAESDAKYVRVALVETAPARAPLPFSGVVRAAQRAPLSFQTPGRLSSRPVRLGQRVQVGDVLAVVSNPQLEPALAAARARVNELSSRLAQAERDLRRVRQLRASGSATIEEAEQQRAGRDQLRSSLALAKAEQQRSSQLLAEAELRAPFAGEVVALHVEPGGVVAPGQPVLELSATDHLEIEIGVPSRIAQQLQAGTFTALSAVGEALPVKGVVRGIAQAALPGQLFRVVIDLPASKQLLPGMSLTVALPTDGEQYLQLPVRSVVDIGRGVPRVFVVQDGVTKATQVVVQRVLGTKVLVRGDLQVGDKVVSAGLAGLRDGQAVQVLP